LRSYRIAEPEAGFEPATYRLQGGGSSAELHRRALGAIRTRTVGLLKTVPLPLGYESVGITAGLEPGHHPVPRALCLLSYVIHELLRPDSNRHPVRAVARPPSGGGALPVELRNKVAADGIRTRSQRMHRIGARRAYVPRARPVRPVQRRPGAASLVSARL
jgi:hypothetical protein